MTHKQRRFVAELAKGKNQTEAAIAAGYPAKSARVMGAKLVANGNIRAELDALNAKANAAVELSAAVLKRDLYETHKEARADKQFSPAVNALGKLLDKCAPDLVQAVVFVAEVPMHQLDEAAWELLPKPA